jgi:hypothetical protein
MLGYRLLQRQDIPTPPVRAVGGLVTVILLLLLIVGCGGKSAQEGSRSEEAAAEKPPSEKAAVENAVRGYLGALNAGNFEKAYSYINPKSETLHESTQQQWVEGWKGSGGLTRAPIKSLKVEDVSGNTATGTVNFAFEYKNGDYYQLLENWKLVKVDGQWKLDKVVSTKTLASGTAEPGALTPFHIAVNTSTQGADPGWQKLSVDLGIRNDGSEPQYVQFPGDSKGSVFASIQEEGRYYDFKLSYPPADTFPAVSPAQPFSDTQDPQRPDIGSFYGFALPPHFALCGLYIADDGFGHTHVLRAEGQIPEGTTPIALELEGYPAAVDLRNKPNQAKCAPENTDSLPKGPVTLVGSESTGSATATANTSETTTEGTSEAILRILDMRVFPRNKVLPQSMLIMELQNQNSLGQFAIHDLRVWLLDDDGIGRTPIGYLSDPCNPNYVAASEMDISLGPSQTAEVGVCFPYRANHHGVALVLSSPSLGIYEVLGVPPGEELAATESEVDTSQEQAPEDVLAAQYEYINSADYENAYALFAEQSQQLVSLEQYSAFFEANAPYLVSDYSFPSVQVQGETATVEVAFTASWAGGEGQFNKTQQLVQEDGGWRVVMRDDQVAAFLETG